MYNMRPKLHGHPFESIYPSNLLIPLHSLSIPSEQEEVAIETQQCPILLRTILGTLYSSGGKKKE